MSKEVITVEAEEVPIEQRVEKSLLTELEKHEITKQFLAEKRDECLSLKLNGQDKEAYTLIRETRLNMKARRVAIEKICKKGREDATKTQKAWIAVEKDWVKIVSEGEDYLEKLEEEFEKEAERIKSEIKRKQEEEFIHRQTDLTKMGAAYIDGNFVLNDVSYEAILIKEADEEVWRETIRPAYNTQYLKNEDKKIKEEQERIEREAELKKQQEEQEKKQKELEARESEIKRKEQEEKERETALQKEKVEAEKQRLADRTKARSGELSSLGMNYNGQDYIYGDVNVNWVEITTMEEGKWEKLIEDIKPVIEERKAQAEAKRLADIEEEKKKAAEEAVKKEKERVAEEKKKEDLKKQQDEEKKQRELEAASDKEKWTAWKEEFNKLPVIPAMKSPAYRTKASIAREKVEEIKEL